MRGVPQGLHHEAPQGTDPLAAHRVALPRHGGGADLLRAEGLLDLAPVGEQAQVGGELVGRLRDRGQDLGDPEVELAGVGLAGDPEGAREAHALGHEAIELADLGVVPLEELEERGLGPGGALDAPEADRLLGVVEVLEVLQQVLEPQAGALAHGRGLGRLKVREAEGRQGTVLRGEGLEIRHDADQLSANQLQGLAQEDEVGVVPHEAGGRSQVEDRARLGAGVPPRVHVGHDVVPQLLLVPGCEAQVEGLQVLTQLRELLVADRQAELLLGLGQGQPQSAPGEELLLLAPQVAHRCAGVPGRERAGEGLGIAHGCCGRETRGRALHVRGRAV